MMPRINYWKACGIPMEGKYLAQDLWCLYDLMGHTGIWGHIPDYVPATVIVEVLEWMDRMDPLRGVCVKKPVPRLEVWKILGVEMETSYEGVLSLSGEYMNFNPEMVDELPLCVLAEVNLWSWRQSRIRSALNFKKCQIDYSSIWDLGDGYWSTRENFQEKVRRLEYDLM